MTGRNRLNISLVVTKQSGYATKQTGYFWTKQLGLNNMLAGYVKGLQVKLDAVNTMYRIETGSAL